MQPKNRIVNQLSKVLPLLLAVSWPGLTATAFAAPPDSAAALEGTKTPAIQKTLPVHPEISVQEEQATPLPPEGDSQTFTVSAFRFSGSLPVSENALQSLLAGKSRGEMTLQRLTALASAVTEYLRQQGYLVAFAYIPAQEIKDGIVEIAVIPGTYGEIQVTGSAAIPPSRLKALLPSAQPGQIIRRQPLERDLLLINDLNGITINANLRPGREPGTSDLVLAAADTRRLSGAVYADNYSNRYTGRNRYGLLLNINNPGRAGDKLSLGGLISSGDLDSYSLGYQAPLGNHGTTLEIKRAKVNYTLGGIFSALDANGEATITAYSVKYPLLRSRAQSLYIYFGYENKDLRDDTSNSHSLKSSRLWNLGLSGTFTDSSGRAVNDISLTQYWGSLGIHDSAEAANDAAGLQTAGHFAKTVLTYQRRQDIATSLSLYFDFTGQLASRNLDSSEKLYLGGVNGVRAYPQGDAAGDEGLLARTELRWRLPGQRFQTATWFLAGFYDYGQIKANHRPLTGTENSSHLTGAGLGLLWTCSRDAAIRLDYAWKTGHTAAEDGKNGRLWLQGVYYY